MSAFANGLFDLVRSGKFKSLQPESDGSFVLRLDVTVNRNGVLALNCNGNRFGDEDQEAGESIYNILLTRSRETE